MDALIKKKLKVKYMAAVEKNNLEKTIEALTKKFGANAIMRGDDVPPVRKLATGIPAFDYVTTGGIFMGQGNELYGQMSSLKSYVAYTALGKFQRYDFANQEPDAISKINWTTKKSRSKDEALSGATFNDIEEIVPRRGYKPIKPIIAKRCVLIDIEGTYERSWGAKLGIDNAGLLYSNPSSVEEGVDLMEAYLSHPEIGLVVFDSFHAVGAAREMDKSMEEIQMGVNAAFWNKASRKIRAALNRNGTRDTTLLYINGAGKSLAAYGDPEAVKNGEGLKWMKASSVRMNGLKTIEGTGETGSKMEVGRNISLKNKKNKFGTPFLEAEFYFSFIDDGIVGKGEIDIVTSLVELGAKFNLIERSGSTYSFGEFKEVGIEKFKNKLRTGGHVNKLRTAVYDEISKL